MPEDEKLVELKPSHILQVVPTESPVNETSSENKSPIEEDTLPQVESESIAGDSETPIENGDAESKTIPETVQVKNAPQDQIVSERNEMEDKETLKLDVYMHRAIQDSILPPIEVTLSTIESSL